MGHLRENGFSIKTKELTGSKLNVLKERYGVPLSLRTCHTGIVEGYVIEGHVPAELVLRLLKEKPAVTGIGVPGMPIGSPGMPGSKNQSYTVFSFDRKGRLQVYKRISPRGQ